MINLTKFYIYVWLLIIIPSITFAQFKLKKVEEFTINTLSDLDILDYFPSQNIYLVQIRGSKEYFPYFYQDGLESPSQITLTWIKI